MAFLDFFPKRWHFRPMAKNRGISRRLPYFFFHLSINRVRPIQTMAVKVD